MITKQTKTASRGECSYVGGVICRTQVFINDLRGVNDGACMLLGPTMDSLRAASILKNLRTLHIRMKQHSKNAKFLAEKFESDGLKTVYPGLKSHPDFELARKQMVDTGAIVSLDLKGGRDAVSKFINALFASIIVQGSLDLMDKTTFVKSNSRNTSK